MGFVRTRYRIRSGEIVDIATGSSAVDCSISGYVSVSNPFITAPRWADAEVLTSAAGKPARYTALKGIDVNYITYLIMSGATTSSIAQTIVWRAQL